MTEASRRAKFGKHLFGRPARLSVGTYMARTDQATYLSEISVVLQLPQSAVSQELSNLVDLELLRRDEVEGSRRVYYTRLPSPWWSVFEAAAQALAVDAEIQTPAEPSDHVP